MNLVLNSTEDMAGSQATVTLGISTLGNLAAVKLCLSAVLTAPVIPGKIVLRTEGQFPDFANFYLEQLVDLARLRGAAFTICRSRSKGIRAARDWQLEHCATDYLWMLDDDVLPIFNCLERMLWARPLLSADWLWIAGVKVDVNNRRGYADYHTRPIAPAANQRISQNHFYDLTTAKPYYGPMADLDTGNVLLRMKRVRELKLSFSLLEDDGPNAGGEDALFAHAAVRKGGCGYLVPSAQSIHLEKEKVTFNDQVARADAVRLGKRYYDKCRPA